MNEWEIVALVLAAGFIPCLAVCVLRDATHALAAVEVASVLLCSILMLLSQGFHRQPFIDLALVFAILSLIGALIFARLMEREL